MAGKKKKWDCYATITAGKYLGEVEAETEEEAIEKAENLESCYVSVCHQCSSDVSDPNITDITVELVH